MEFQTKSMIVRVQEGFRFKRGTRAPTTAAIDAIIAEHQKQIAGNAAVINSSENSIEALVEALVARRIASSKLIGELVIDKALFPLFAAYDVDYWREENRKENARSQI